MKQLTAFEAPIYAPSLVQKNGRGEVIAVLPLRAVPGPPQCWTWNAALEVQARREAGA